MVGGHARFGLRIVAASLLVLLAAGASSALDTSSGLNGPTSGLDSGNANTGSRPGSGGDLLRAPLNGALDVPLVGRLSFAGMVLLGGGMAAAAYLAVSVLGTKFVTAQNVLENDARRELYEYIKTNPGTHLRATAAALGLSTTNALWHLRKLEQSNLVNSKRLEGYKVFYPVEGGLEAKRMGLAMAVLRNENARQILELISQEPAAHQREMARRLSLNHGTIRWHLKKLSAVGLVLELRKDHVSQYFISELGNLALARVKGVPVESLPPVPNVILPGAPMELATGIATEPEAAPVHGLVPSPLTAHAKPDPESDGVQA
ncbi:MAG TPA: winged helix-turn-helix transcriptional regulator [Candidatus Thermoplasmatota archaeon]|nr:winged helix-turn-helix transcriptional regulator [Candidatus Thermoplasmatota archaeon]